MKTETLADRLNLAMKEAGMSQGALAKASGVAQPTIWRLASGNAAGSTKIVQIASALGVNVDWLLSGTGEMKVGESSGIGPQWWKPSTWDSSTPLDDDEVEVPFLKDIELACGTGRVSSDDHNGFKLRFSKATLRRVGANSDGSGVICFPAAGDSMEPIIPDGTTVAVDTNNKRIVDGKIYAIAQPGAGDEKLKRIKQLYRQPGGRLTIRSFNREDEEAQESDVEIIGRVFWYSVLL